MLYADGFGVVIPPPIKDKQSSVSNPHTTGLHCPGKSAHCRRSTISNQGLHTLFGVAQHTQSEEGGVVGDSVWGAAGAMVVVVVVVGGCEGLQEPHQLSGMMA